MKKIATLIAAALVAVAALAQESKIEFKPYGFVRSYFAFDSRVSTAGLDDLYYWMPKDVKMVNGEDVNAVSSFRFAAITSRLGLDIKGYEIDGIKINGKFEADFYSGLTGNTGTAQFRLRQAFVTLSKGSFNWKIGQAWHPMAADLPDIFSLESGAPFGPFSRSPLVQYDLKLTDALSMTAAAIWQMQYCSTGPEGVSANYIKYGCTPELYFGLNLKSKNGSVLKVGGDVLSIKPRQVNANGFAKDRLTAWNAFVYGNAKLGGLDWKTKVTFANDGSHFNLLGGYGVSHVDAATDNWDYTATRTLSGWTTLAYRKAGRWVPQMLLGYIKMFGTPEEVLPKAGDQAFSWVKNSANVINQMFRIQPEIVYNLGKIGFGLEYMATGAQYGESDSHMLASGNLHWVVNHRVQVLVKYTF